VNTEGMTAYTELARERDELRAALTRAEKVVEAVRRHLRENDERAISRTTDWDLEDALTAYDTEKGETP
jgi:hypothetical protein